MILGVPLAGCEGYSYFCIAYYYMILGVPLAGCEGRGQKQLVAFTPHPPPRTALLMGIGGKKLG